MSRIFPSRSDYEVIIHHLDRFAVQPSLKMAKVQMQANDTFPQVYSGGRAVVFPVLENGSKYALKCWIQSLGDLAIRYQQIDSFVHQNKPSFMLNSSYLEDELLVNGVRYPILKMEWVDSLTLKEWININISNSSALSLLAESFLELCREMHALSFSHGDLQHENILVGNKANLVLVDYDSAYIPGLEHLRDEIKGLPGFQHNSRAKLEFCNPCADYFSEYVIYLSLFGLARNPRLWDEAKDHNRLLFSEGDIRNPGSSIIVQELRSIPELSKVLDAYLDNCKFDSLEKMIPLDQITGISDNHVILPKPKPKSSKTTTSANPLNFTGSRFDNFETWSPTSSQNSTAEWDFARPVQNSKVQQGTQSKRSSASNSNDASSLINVIEDLKYAMSLTPADAIGSKADSKDTGKATSSIVLKTPGCFVNHIVGGHWTRSLLEEISFAGDSLAYVWLHYPLAKQGSPVSTTIAISSLFSWYSALGTIYLLSGPESCALMFTCSESRGIIRDIGKLLEKAGIADRRTSMPTGISDPAPEPTSEIIQTQESELGEESKKIASASTSSDCFVATVVYGSANHPDVVALRLYRDEVLMHTRFGRRFIRFYYLMGPIVANFLSSTSLAPSLRPILSLIVNHIGSSQSSRPL